jgi:hypothetical protein
VLLTTYTHFQWAIELTHSPDVCTSKFGLFSSVAMEMHLNSQLKNVKLKFSGKRTINRHLVNAFNFNNNIPNYFNFIDLFSHLIAQWKSGITKTRKSGSHFSIIGFSCNRNSGNVVPVA